MKAHEAIKENIYLFILFIMTHLLTLTKVKKNYHEGYFKTKTYTIYQNLTLISHKFITQYIGT